ncbi:MAG: hypothetical protein QOG23_164 [Blastocatellia bacterium]|jgi:hypothetical protein|nr:hypothetical protein [Blastocatellia bacterium]
MKKLKTLGATLLLTLALGTSELAAETPTFPCGSMEPGQIPTPPCAIQIADGDSNLATQASPGDMGTAAVSNETSLTRIAADLLLEFLPLF